MFRLRDISLLVLATSSFVLVAGAEERSAEGIPVHTAAAIAPPTSELEARGPRTIFESAEAAAVDALTYAHREAREARETDRVRGGTIYRAGGGYSYGEIRVAGRVAPHRVSYTLKPGDVARFVTYPRNSNRRANWRNERPSHVDRRGVTANDPLHRPLYILHPSLSIRVYRGEGQDLEEVANLRRSTRPLSVAGN